MNKQGEVDEEYIQHIESLTFGVDINSASIQQEKFRNTDNGSDVKKVELVDLGENVFSTLSTLSTADASLPVVRLYQRMSGVVNPNSSCGPTAGAMITNYYKSLGYNVRASSYYGGNAGLINQLYYMMNSSFIGTNQYSLHNGLQTHLNLDKNLWVGKSRGHASGVEPPTYANVVNAIDKKYPLAMLTYLSSEDPYHWTVINGYYSNGDISYLNPDGSSSSSTKVKASLMFESKAGYTYMALK
ncbi:C39 family peptidase [Lysinibacillus sp. NPDC095746]|uniref:C39 family peptidase n=1 Tax=Lysinibacillus sp. NPDC095746 TaxID=3364134 RepID=UPI003829F2A3